MKLDIDIRDVADQVAEKVFVEWTDSLVTRPDDDYSRLKLLIAKAVCEGMLFANSVMLGKVDEMQRALDEQREEKDV